VKRGRTVRIEKACTVLVRIREVRVFDKANKNIAASAKLSSTGTTDSSTAKYRVRLGLKLGLGLGLGFARALFMGKTVVYHPGKEKTPLPIVLRPLTVTVEKVRFLPIDDAIIPELKNPDTVYISDSHEPETVDAWTATIMSPRRDRWHKKNKLLDSRLVFFPAFTWTRSRSSTVSASLRPARKKSRRDLSSGVET
jgi:hypothetical protein